MTYLNGLERTNGSDYQIKATNSNLFYLIFWANLIVSFVPAKVFASPGYNTLDHAGILVKLFALPTYITIGYQVQMGNLCCLFPLSDTISSAGMLIGLI